MRTDLNTMHERNNCKMRWEATRQKESKLSAHDHLGDLSGNGYPCGKHNRGTEICKVNVKSQIELTSSHVDKIVTSTQPSSNGQNGKIVTVTVTDTDSGKCKIDMGNDCGKTKIAKDMGSDMNKAALGTENKENELNVIVPNEGREEKLKIASGCNVTQGQVKQTDLSDDDSSNEDSENECLENQEEVTEKPPVLNINIPSDSVSDVESQLKNLAITESGDDKEDLCERSPMGNERHHVRSDLPYPQVSSKLRFNGGGIVAELFAPTDSLPNVSQPATVHFNINDLPEANNNNLLQSAPEFPFCEESFPELNNNFLLLSSSTGSPFGEESCPLPDVEQEHLDAWLNDDSSNVDKGSRENTEVDGQLGHLQARNDLTFFNSTNIHPEKNELNADAVWPTLVSHPLPYRQAESIASLSSPSSGSRYSSECSPSSSPVPSLVDSINGKSDSDTENELWKIDANLQNGYASLSDVPACSAQSASDKSVNNLMSSSIMCGYPQYPLASHSSTRLQTASGMQLAPPVGGFQPATGTQQAQLAIILQPAQPTNHVQTVQSTNCLQAAQPARGMQHAQLAIHLQQMQPPRPPPSISLQPGHQNIQLASSTNSPAVIIQGNVQPVTYMHTQQSNIQQGPVIPETIPVSAQERMASKLDKNVKNCAVLTLAKLKDDEVAKGDKHGDTQLMILIASDEVPHKLEYIYAMVYRIKNISGALVARNAQNHSALRLACLFLHHMAFVPRFIAEVMLEKGLPVNEVDREGNTLLHLLCAQGDSHVEVLAELLSMKDQNGVPCFDINQHNHREGTPLHMAVKMHSKELNCSQTVALLLSQGANVLAEERFGGLTALHMAIRESCDPLLVQLLLQAAERRNINLVNKGDYRDDTALHYVSLRNDIARQQQAKVVQLLVWYGAMSNRCGSQGRTPLALVSAERKLDIQKIIHKR